MNAYKITGADLAEVYYSHDASVASGDIVSIDNTLQAGVKKTIGSYDKNILGVISTEPGLVIGDRNANSTGTPVLVALTGRVLVKTNLENGAIKAGDYLTSS